jgi:membrane protein YdbS with pleckstrin-like domain
MALGNSKNVERASGGGINLSVCLFLIFLVLKLCGAIDWSWWWVTAPPWWPLGLIAVLLVIAGICTLVLSIVGAFR